MRALLDQANPHSLPLSYPVAMIVGCLVAAFLVPAVRRLAIGWGAMDDPERARKVHTRVTPRLGGLAIAAGFYAAVGLLLLLDTSVGRAFLAESGAVVAIGVGGLAMLGLGVYDDRYGANAKVKLAVQIPAALLLAVYGFHFDVIALPWGGTFELGVFGLPVSVLWVVGVTNAINLIDGLDGLAAGVALVAVATTFLIALVSGNVVMCLITAALGGSLLGFLFHNFHPATIFMGDTGSLFIGYLVAATSVMANMKSSTTVALAVPILLLSVPLLDTSFAFFRRILRGRSPFDADNEHVHHRLLGLGLSHRHAVLAIYAFSIVLGVATLGMAFGNPGNTVWILLGYALFCVVVARRLGYVRVERWATDFRQGRLDRKDRQTRREVAAHVAEQVRGATNLAEAFERLKAVHALHQYDEMWLELLDKPEASPLRWRRDAPASRDALDVRFDIESHGRALVRVHYLYGDGRRQLAIDDEWLMQLVHGALAKCLA